VDVEPSGLTTVGLPALEGRGGGEHAAEDEAALPPPVDVPEPAPALLEATGAEEKAAVTEADEEADAEILAAETRIA